MLIISNNVKSIGMEFPKDAVIRINIAWIRSLEDLVKILTDNASHDIWVDYPTGRRKPPVPTLAWEDVVGLLPYYNNVKYFAFSNGEEAEAVKEIRSQVPSDIKLIPKIETVKGIKNLLAIVEAAQTDTIMFDAEDLYTDLSGDAMIFGLLSDYTRKLCADNGITCLRLQGVIFA